MHRHRSILALCCLFSISTTLLVRAADPDLKAPAPVLSIREFELKPAVKAEEFEGFVRREMAGVAGTDAAGMKVHILKGDRGARKGRYILIWEFDSAATRNLYFPREGGAASPAYQQVWKRMRAVMDKFSTYVKETPAYTDYVRVSD